MTCKQHKCLKKTALVQLANERPLNANEKDSSIAALAARSGNHAHFVEQLSDISLRRTGHYIYTSSWVNETSLALACIAMTALYNCERFYATVC